MAVVVAEEGPTDMPSPSTAELPIPTSWDEFEDLIADLMRRLWDDPYVTRNGRQGQAQNGIDIYGQPKGGRRFAGVQCRNVAVFVEKDLRAAVKEARRFRPKLHEFVVATTAPRDAGPQKLARSLSSQGQMRVHIRYWEDISLDLSGFPDLLEKHFPGFMKQRTKMEDVLRALLNSRPSDFTHRDNVFTYGPDVSLQLQEEDSDQTFTEPWSSAFPDPTAYKHQVHILYGGAKVESFWFVLVDGARYTIPFPSSRTDLRIDKLQYAVAKAIDTQGSLDEGLRRAGILVVDTHDRSKAMLKKLLHPVAPHPAR